MVICKFFLQGTCRFGENCKFEHQLSDHTYGGNSSILIQQNYNHASPKPQTTSNIDTTTLVKAVVTDMTSAEKGGQWLLSSYAPYKEKPQFPGFEDHSMEEVRYLFYEAIKNGSAEQYKQNLQMMLQQAMIKIKALQNPSAEAVSMLKTIYDTPPSSSLNSQNNQTPFGNNSGSSIFGAPPQSQKSIFGGTSPSRSVFGGGNALQPPVFNSPTSSSIFGGQQPASSIFGAPANTQQQNQPIFGAAQPPAPSSSIFGAPPAYGGGASQSQPIFGQQPKQTSVFGQPNQQIFAQLAPQQQNVFQQSANAGPFGGQTPASGAFSAASGPFGTSQGSFGATQSGGGLTSLQVGASASASKSPLSYTQSVFSTGGSVFPSVVQNKPNEEFYSKLEDLTEEEIRWFQSDDLDVMKIPEKPPTYEMCF